MNAIPQYSVVIPVFNSEESLEELFDGILKQFDKLGLSFEVIFVDDRSPDNSWNVIRKLKKENPEAITAIRLAKNFGQHNATLCGLEFVKGNFVITMDDDLQHPPEEISKLILAKEETEADLVYGIARHKEHSHTRNLGSKSLKTSSKMLHDGPGEGSSFRLITRDIANKVKQHQQHFIFLDEIPHWYTDDIAFAEVIHAPRKYKKSGYSWHKLVSMMGNIVLYYTMVPLKFLVWGGFIFSVITFCFGLFQIVKKLIFDVPLGYTSLIVAILFSTSIILFSLGIIGEYLSRIYQVQNRKPPYSIQKIL